MQDNSQPELPALGKSARNATMVEPNLEQQQVVAFNRKLIRQAIAANALRNPSPTARKAVIASRGWA